MFLADMDRRGSKWCARWTSGQAFAGGHAVIRFTNVRVPARDAWRIGQGSAMPRCAGSGASTHCMRWLGAARRAHRHRHGLRASRQAFGGEAERARGGRLHARRQRDGHPQSRLAIWHTAWLLDQGERGGTNSSMSKVFCSEAVWRVVDRCVQVLGGQGVTDDTLVARIFPEVRAFRIYDGPSEVHRCSLAQRIAWNGANW